MEDFSNQPAGYQDNDLLLRAQLLRLNYINLPDIGYSRAIFNTHKEEIINTVSNLSWEEMDEHNRQMSLKNIISNFWKTEGKRR